MSNPPFRPMLAEDVSVEHFAKLFRQYDRLLASYKLDGIRCIIKDGLPWSRSMKPIPNAYIHKLLSHPGFTGFDGELIIGDPFGEGVFARTTSGVMSREGQPQFAYHVFDLWSDPFPFEHRSQQVGHYIDMMQKDYPFLVKVEQFRVFNLEGLQELEGQALEKGYEGLIVRTPNSPYKQGRSTVTQSWMLKLKRFQDSEAEVIGFVELYHNLNEAKTDERGFTRRSSHLSGRVPAGILGALHVRDIHHGWEFYIGSGFDHDLRRRIWEARDRVRGQIVKYKFLPIGMIDVPRHPIFLGFRDIRDL